MDDAGQDEQRLPSFNDFSPGILDGDIRKPLEIVAAHPGDREGMIAAFADQFFGGKRNKRSSTNIPTTLVHTGLATGDPLRLTEFGKRVLDAPTPSEAARIFCKKIVDGQNGLYVIEAITNLNARNFRGKWKTALKEELELLGVTHLTTGTTDHTTLANWMAEGDLLVKEGPGRGYTIADDELKRAIGITSGELAEILALSRAQQLFLRRVRLLAETEGDSFVPISTIITELLTTYPGLFPEDQFRAEISGPLEAAGWVEVKGRTGGRGAKSGRVRATARLRSIPTDYFSKVFESAIPPDLRSRLNTPMAEVTRLLRSSEKHERGLGFELLTLKMLIDLDLEPRGFRQRSAETAYAELDLIAEGAALLFSRWVVQCKCYPENRVHLSDVAKEVGIAVQQRAHVVMVVTLSGFTSEAEKYAEEISRSTHLQVILVDGVVVESYLSAGRRALLDHMIESAQRTRDIKREKADGVVLKQTAEENEGKAIEGGDQEELDLEPPD